MQPELLVSVCNVALDPRPSCLLKMNVVTHRTEWIDVGLADDLVISGLGICADDHFVYHLSTAKSDHATRLSILDRQTLSPAAVQRLPDVIDPHSICIRDGELFIASTGHDEILGYELVGCEAVRPRTIWTPTGAGADTQHVNSLAIIDGDLHCSAFGVGDPATSWRTANGGFVYNVDRGTMVVEGLQQPHSVSSHDGELYYCNSRAGTVETSSGIIAYLGGYSRGLAFGNEAIYAGTSFARRSKTAGDVFLNPSDQGPLQGRCAVVHLPDDDGLRVEVGMTGLAFEIYDLHLR